MSENYLGIMMRILSPHNYSYRILSPSIYDDAEKLRFIGILAYPKMHRVPFHPIIQVYNLISKGSLI